MSNSAYRELTLAEKFYKSFVWDNTITVGLAVLEGYVPILKIPILKDFLELFVRSTGDWIYKNLVLVTDVTAIKLVNAEHQAAYEKESLRLKIVAQESGTDSDAFKKEHEIAKDSLSKFIQFGR